MLLDRNEDGLETHGDLPFVRTPPAARGGGRGFGCLAVSRRTNPRAIGTPVALFYHANSQASSTATSPVPWRASRPFAAPWRSRGAETRATAARSRAGPLTGG